MEMQVLVQKRDELDAKKAIEFIENCKNSKLAIIHSSLKDEIISLDFFDTLVRELKTPFVGMRVGGTVTNQGYSEDSVAIAVLCGDFDVEVFHESINYEKLEETAEDIINISDKADLCLVYSASPIKKNVFLDAILRRIQKTYPKLQMFGGVSFPPPIVITNEGIYNDRIICALIKGIKCFFDLYTGFKVDSTKDEEFIVTKSDEFYIYEINGKPASEEYSKIQHMRPYFFNALSNLLIRPDPPRLLRSMSRISSVMYDAISKATTRFVGAKVNEKLTEALIVLEIGDGGNNYILPPFYVPEGMVLRWVTIPKDYQLEAYDSLYGQFSDATPILMTECAFRPLWFGFDFDALEDKLKKFKCPFMISYTFGEFGTYLPYKGPEQKLVHGGSVKALIFK